MSQTSLQTLSSSVGLTGYHTNVFEINPLFEIPVMVFNLNNLRERGVFKQFCISPFNYCRNSCCLHLQCFLLFQVEIGSSAAANTVASFQHWCQSHQIPASRELPCLFRFFQFFVLAAGALMLGSHSCLGELFRDFNAYFVWKSSGKNI